MVSQVFKIIHCVCSARSSDLNWEATAFSTEKVEKTPLQCRHTHTEFDPVILEPGESVRIAFFCTKTTFQNIRGFWFFFSKRRRVVMVCHNHCLCKGRNSNHCLWRKQYGLFRHQLFSLTWAGYSTRNVSSVWLSRFLEGRYQTSLFQLSQIIVTLSDSGIAKEEKLTPWWIRHWKVQSLSPVFLKYFLLT